MRSDSGNAPAQSCAEVIWQMAGSGVAVVTLCQPAKRNALTLSMWQSLGEVFAALGADRDVRSIIVTGSAGHFSSGADISEFGSVRADPDSAKAYDEINDTATAAIYDCPKPVIAALSGSVVGGGLGIALACDFRIADTTARMGITAGRLGIVYGILDCTLLVQRVGLTNAKEILFTSKVFDAGEANRLGLVDHLVDGSAMEAATSFAAEMTKSAPLSAMGHKLILNAIANNRVEEQSMEIDTSISRAYASQDYIEGRRAFSERRKPVFRGT